MDTILFITDLHSGSRIPELAGARDAAAEFDWHVEEIEVHFRKFGDKLPHELRDQLETLRKGIADMKD